MTKYQEIYIVKGVYGKALILDGKWQSCTEDEFLYHEGLVHPAMICHGSPRKVLVLGGSQAAKIFADILPDIFYFFANDFIATTTSKTHVNNRDGSIL